MVTLYNPIEESYKVWCRSHDDLIFMKFISNEKFDPHKYMKCCLNSVYGKLVSEMGIDGKENDKMIKGLDYILVHVDKEPLIIFKKQIVSIAKDEGRAYIQCTNCGYLSDESYADIVKQAL